MTPYKPLTGLGGYIGHGRVVLSSGWLGGGSCPSQSRLHQTHNCRCYPMCPISPTIEKLAGLMCQSAWQATMVLLTVHLLFSAGITEHRVTFLCGPLGEHGGKMVHHHNTHVSSQQARVQCNTWISTIKQQGAHCYLQVVSPGLEIAAKQSYAAGPWMISPLLREPFCEQSGTSVDVCPVVPLR
ncbi:hypothetical protein I7I50_08438 [Histoplasma capsulatum G186AR]|uniref:Uncharacterized protein n=1 Tax=Ajellomyces capsulatus TaxID=5037 RepID=A0A8H8CYX5_AJECA|nr:hypothetical protein I7I52_05953 [Histoplasma capsulatum]QSS73602.1 hypothetical protein I7I50_08438 [Histoplasma capsulatum G186AR]